MPEFNIFERAIHNIGLKLNPILGTFRQKKLQRTDFTIISNNCWGGVCYEYFNLPKQSPTVGMYFFADEYIKFVSDIHRYLEGELIVVSSNQSKYYDELVKRGQEDVLVGKIENIEFVLLHYKDKQEAIDKWCRRVKRINWDNIIFKFSHMNACTDEHIIQFEKICREKNYRHFEFVTHPFDGYPDAYVIKPGPDGQVPNDTFYFKKYCNIFDYLNGSN